MDPGTSIFIKNALAKYSQKLPVSDNTCAFHPFYYSGMEIPGGKHLSDSNNPVRLWTQLFLRLPSYPYLFSPNDALPALCGPVAYKVCNDLCLKQGSCDWEKETVQVLWNLAFGNQCRDKESWSVTVKWCCFNRFRNIPMSFHTLLALRANTHFSCHYLEGNSSWRDSFSTPLIKTTKISCCCLQLLITDSMATDAEPFLVNTWLTLVMTKRCLVFILGLCLVTSNR